MPIRREVGAAVCLLLSVFTVIGYFNAEALFIKYFFLLLKGLVGYGFFFAAPVLLMSSYILAFHRGRPVLARVICTLCFPAAMGGLLHLFLVQTPFSFNPQSLGILWASGQASSSGGMLSGFLAESLRYIFSTAGAAVIFVLAAAVLLLTMFNRTFVDIVDAIKNRPLAQYQYTEPKSDQRQTAPDAHPKKARRQLYDLPVEEAQAVSGNFINPLDILKPKSEKPTRQMPSVPPPDEMLIGEAIGDVLPLSIAVDEPAVGSSDPSSAPPVQLEPVTKKVTAEDTAKAAAQVFFEIAEASAHNPTAYQYPPASLLIEGASAVSGDILGELKNNQERLAETIRSFGVVASIVNVTRGPSVTRYEMELDQGVKLNKITNLADDIALALGATGVRIAPIPNKISTVGAEVPNRLVSPVNIHEVISSSEFRSKASKVSFAVGKDIAGNCIVGDIAKLPHLLIAGTTGSGKSVCTNSLIISLLYKATPEEVRLIMVDPKMVELGIYNGIPHLLIPVVTDPKKAAGALQWAVSEMMKRYRIFSEIGVRDLAAYNAHASGSDELEKLPQIVVVIDELADLMLVAAKEVEESICRVAQMGRAAGMHLIIATQRPSADVITGLMKANIPSRIAFAVASALESRIILDTTGAEKLVGRGDMLWCPLGLGKPLRVQGCLISDSEVSDVVDFVKKSGTTAYDDSIMYEIEKNAAEREKGSKGTPSSEGFDDSFDEMLPSAIDVVIELGQASVSMLQRRLKLGYGRAARLVDQMEEKGIVGPFEGSKPRQVLISKAQWQEMQLKQGIVVSPAPEAVPEHEPPFDMEE